MSVLCLAAIAQAQVPYSRIRDAAKEPGSWLTYSGGYHSQRFTTLKEINRKNVAGLRSTWVYQLRRPGTFEASPIVVDGIMYIVEPPSTVTALDARAGRALWSWSPTMPKDVKALGFPPTNRGVAILGDMVYVGTLDAHLVALDAKTGAVRWDVIVADNKTGHSITCAPLALDGKIITGISGGEAGIRGFLDAYDPRTGERLWRFWTTPAKGEPFNETWGGDSWKTGGGATWLTGSYDPDLRLLYWGIGNPGPDWNDDNRPGDNLYTCSLVALDPSTGKLKWHFQFTPHDTHDWDANQIPVLLDAKIGGRMRKLIATANRNAFFYLLDRGTGEFLLGTPYAKQTWAKGLDPRGRPIVLPNTDPSEKGTLVWPSLQGAANWYSPAYSPQTGLFYHSAREMSSIYFKADVEYKPGEYFMGGGEQQIAGDKAYGAVRAIEPTTGRIRWEFRLLSPPWAGLMATAGGIVFGGSNEGNFFALDDRSGKVLWQFQTGAKINANPVSFTSEGRQRIAIAAGHALFVFGL